MALDDFDSDEGERRYSSKRSSYGNQTKTSSILKNSSSTSSSNNRRVTQYSDDDDDETNFNNSSGRLSNRNTSNRYDSPLNSNRSEMGTAAGKPPSGRLQPLGSIKSSSSAANDYSSSISKSKSSSSYADYDTPPSKYESLNKYESNIKTKNSLPAITYPTNKTNYNDSDDSITDRYNKYTKSKQPATTSAYDSSKPDKYDQKYTSDKYDSKQDSRYDKVINSFVKDDLNGLSTSKYDSKYDSKFETKYDTYDEDDMKKDSTNKFYRSESPLKSSYKADALDKLNLRGVGISPSTSTGGIGGIPNSKGARSNSLDRLNSTSAYNNVNGLSSTMSSIGPGTLGNKLQKYSSTSNVAGDNGSDRSYIVNSLNMTSMSIREAKSRSYLVGSLSALNGKGLLSNEELDRHFVDRKARVLISTWNMGGVKKMPTNMDELVLPDTIQTMPDIYVIGVQEFELNPKEWEICLQEHIGPAHVKISSYFYGSLGVVLFVKRELIWFCSVVEYDHISLRAVNGPTTTKASLLVSFQLFGTLMCFICSHFIAGEGKLEQRIENYKTTINNIKLPKKLTAKPKSLNSTDGTENFDSVFWMGDFNFLITKEREKIEKKVSNLREKRAGVSNYEEIINHDELNQVIIQDRAFKNFLEGRITFEPTYKYDINSDTYDTSEKCRIPSYCDRILYRSRHKGNISCSYYDVIKEIKLSDHRPVFGLYEVAIRPGVDKVPLSYGEFDRQVYAAGYQRRQMYRAYNIGFNENGSRANLQESNKSLCVIQ